MRTIIIFISGLALLTGVSEGADLRSDPIKSSEAQRLVQEALQAEVDGNSHLRDTLLKRAAELDAAHPPARWHSGEVRIDGKWLSIEDAERTTNAAGVVAKYRELRQAVGGSLVGEVRLATWCRKNHLTEQEHLHWWNVLQLAPSHKQARRRLNVGEFMGRLMTVDEIQHWKLAKQRYDQALEKWTLQLNEWRRQIDNSSSPEKTEAWRLLAELSEVEAVPALGQMFDKVGAELQGRIVLTLGNMQEQLAVDALVRIAIDGESSEIREAASRQLGNRSWYRFVPGLLETLQTPVELRYFVSTHDKGASSHISYSQERPTAVVNLSRSVDGAIYSRRNPNRRTRSRPLREFRAIDRARRFVFLKNETSKQRNQRIYTALQTSTGQQLQPTPQSWWRWWQEHNELHAGQQKPDIYQEYTYRFRVIVSCFLAGTPVWTETGPVSIEKIRRGDRVLAQDSESGELSYRVVLSTTTRPPSPTLRIHVGSEDIVTTPGHPLWVVGSGWRMAKELEVGSQLHTVHGGAMIDRIESGPEAEAYNLVVAEDNTYFVGQQRILAHDNTLRRAGATPVPGWTTASSK